jgi:ribose transport system permease protein
LRPMTSTTPQALERRGAVLGRDWSVLLPYATALVLVVVFSVSQPAFLSWANFWNIVRQSAVLLVASIAETTIILIGAIDLSVGAVMTLAAIVAAATSASLGGFSLLLGLLVGAACGGVNGILNATLKLPSFLVTLGTLFVFQSLGLIVSKGAPLPWSTPLTSALAGGVVFGSVPKIGFWALGVLAIAIVVAAKTRFGQALYAVGDNERAARMSGLATNRIKLAAFVVAGGVAGLAGMMLGIRSFSAAPGMGDSFLLDTIAATVLGGTSLTGGVGGPARTVFGVLVIIILANGMTMLQIDPFYQVGIRGVVVIAAVMMTMRRRTADAVVK